MPHNTVRKPEDFHDIAVIRAVDNHLPFFKIWNPALVFLGDFHGRDCSIVIEVKDQLCIDLLDNRVIDILRVLSD
ncbi:hypothetical protein SDC9_167068 [bioreactor metagenome]|uniref:Uncharacterized protein n=1 Tax=bioreactor metagenome TaxID=1076179 RepID=A0A645G0N4_9ZZZZ